MDNSNHWLIVYIILEIFPSMLSIHNSLLAQFWQEMIEVQGFMKITFNNKEKVRINSKTY